MANDYEDDDLSEEEIVRRTRSENSRLRSSNRRLRTAVLDKITKDKDSEEFPNLNGTNAQTYAIVAVVDGLDRDIAESEKAIAQKDTNSANAQLVTQVFEHFIQRAGNPASMFATGERGERTVGTSQRLRPENRASDNHMRIGRDDIDINEVYGDPDKDKGK